MAWTSPRTWVAGEIVTAALLNTHLRDNLLALFDKTAATTVAAAAGVTSTNTYSWLRTTVTVVHVDITTTTAIAASAQLFTLPVGHRPPATIFGVVHTVSGTSVNISVQSSGVCFTSDAISTATNLRGQIVLPLA